MFDFILGQAPVPLIGDFARYRYPLLITFLSHLLLTYTGISAGYARITYKVPYPETRGPPEFNRLFRAHCNQCEQYPQFYVLLWTFSLFVSPEIGAGVGLVWIVLRYLYFCRYRDSGIGIRNFTLPSYMCWNFLALGIFLKAITS